MKVQFIQISDRNETFYAARNIDVNLLGENSLIELVGVTNEEQYIKHAKSDIVKMQINGGSEFPVFCINNDSNQTSLKFEALTEIFI